jgi:23S rRNA pseudouridine1911/1915/1917 synthase
MLDVIFEDNHLLVLNKPTLIATMGAAPGEPSLLEHARQYIRKRYDKPGNVYLGVVSRLDAHVSGVIMFARTSKCASRISEQLRNQTVEKTYRAIVPAGVLPAEGTLENWVVKDDASRRVRCVANRDVTFAGEHGKTEHPKRAKLHFSVIATDSRRGVDLIEVRLETGRKHQIRVQLSHEGCPIIGDVKYNSPSPFPSGIALHCFRLQLIHPTLKTPLDFEVEPPKFWKMANFDV